MKLRHRFGSGRAVRRQRSLQRIRMPARREEETSNTFKIDSRQNERFDFGVLGDDWTADGERTGGRLRSYVISMARNGWQPVPVC